ncbi:hypothetical protein RhiirC2_783025 [Rhizophagus irregularis]|uniref:F-box domain-containing protein n=1 Tax=Rhizophagus irregularis TaxID=588596 RepID=A0A2N1N1U3_9GLOM|nr:hypothetical protein RhiirC2_783025 [Rhizophagus irregularis]
MACSKIFSGDLPELIYEIIKYFQNDYSTLYSCVLVNRLWCRLAIPLLWENPFSIPTKNHNFIIIYLYNLNDRCKMILNEYQIIDNLLLSNSLFNYPSFLKYVNIDKVISSVAEWMLEVSNTINRYFLRDNFGELVCILLFEMFIENEVSLHTLEVDTSFSCIKYYDMILEMIIRNPNFIHNVRNLKLSILSSINDTLIKNRISQLINLQQNLKKISFSSNTLPLYQSLLLSKESNCSNTLNTIIFRDIDFRGINNLDKIFEQLNVLESVHFIFCYSLDNFIQQIINLTKPFKLKSLSINEVLQIELLRLLLQKSGNYLENVEYGIENIVDFELSLKQLFLKLIIKYCKNIKFLYVYRIERNTSTIIFSLIENIKQNLNYLSIHLSNYQDRNRNNKLNLTILQNLGAILPPKLEYLCFSFYNIKADDFEVFLKNSQDTFYKTLVINNTKEAFCNGIDILPYIKEYIMKKKRVKYLAIRYIYVCNIFGEIQEIDLSNLKDEVKEFELYNIEVLNYIILATDIYRFVNKID